MKNTQRNICFIIHFTDLSFNDKYTEELYLYYLNILSEMYLLNTAWAKVTLVFVAILIRPLDVFI